MTANIKTIDIETAPTIAYVWKGFKENIALNQVLRDGAIISFAAKDLGVKKVRYQDNADKADFYDDADLVQALWHELDEADIVIGHNVNRFDVRKINARFLAHGLPPPSPYKTIDTYTAGRQVAAFWSQRLEWVAEVTTEQRKMKHGKYPGFELWRAALAGDPKAWAEMRKYNPQDCVTTEAYYLKLRPYIVGHPSLPLYGDGDGCPRCGSHKLEEHGVFRARTRVYPMYRCGSCHGFSRGAASLKTPRAAQVQ